MELELVSVIIPVYNAAEYISRCIESVLCQTYQNLQVICIDDCSQDDSATILEAYAAQDPRITFLHLEENGGVSHARNVGLEYATGEYVMFVDADDWLHTNCVSNMLNCKNSSGIVAGRIQNLLTSADFTKQSEDSTYTSATYNYLEAIEKPTIKSGVCAKLYSGALVKNNRFNESLKYGEDTLFNLDILVSAKPDVTFIDTDVYYYDRSHQSATSTLPVKEICKYVDALIHRAARDEYFVEDAAKAALSARYVASVKRDDTQTLFLREKLKLTKKIVKRSHTLSLTKKLIFIVFITFPASYRYYRLRSDKSLLVWEQNEQAKRTT